MDFSRDALQSALGWPDPTGLLPTTRSPAGHRFSTSLQQALRMRGFSRHIRSAQALWALLRCYLV